MNQNHLTLGVSAVALAVGAAGGYLFARKQLELKYEELAQREIAEAKEFYARLYKKEGFETPERAAETLGVDVDGEPEPERHLRLVKAAEAMQTYQVDGDQTTGEVVNVFQRAAEDDADIVEPVGEQDVPYVIKQATYMEGDQNYTQCTVTWYQLDGVLSDERDEPIDDVDEKVGLNNLQRFGQRSGQPHVVYVRNDADGIDYEILRSEGSFAKEVLGIGT